MIGQKIRLQYLIPLAIEKLQKDIFVDAELYKGDLLEIVLRIDTSFGTVMKIIGYNFTNSLKTDEKR